MTIGARDRDNLLTKADDAAIMDLSALQDVLLAPDFDAELRASEIIQSGAAATESHRAELQRAEAEVDAIIQEQERDNSLRRMFII